MHPSEQQTEQTQSVMVPDYPQPEYESTQKQISGIQEIYANRKDLFREVRQRILMTQHPPLLKEFCCPYLHFHIIIIFSWGSLFKIGGEGE
jgi:hypothetical protein